MENKEKILADIEYLKSKTRSIIDYPRKGIVFRDLTTIFQDGKAMKLAVDLMAASIVENQTKKVEFDKFAAIEARGFVLAGALTQKLGGGLVMIRKPGKLPYLKKHVDYKLEYGEDSLEIHLDAIKPGENIILVDDLLATGGTAKAACNLIEQLGGRVAKILFLVELPDLHGRERLSGYDVDNVISFSGK